MVAGISGFRDQYIPGQIPSADLLHRWAEEEHLVWLYSKDILAEYKEVLNRLHVRSAVIGTLINFIRERGESGEVRSSTGVSPDPKDDAFWCLCRGRERELHLHSQREGLSTEPPESESHPAVAGAAKSLRKATAARISLTRGRRQTPSEVLQREGRTER